MTLTTSRKVHQWLAYFGMLGLMPDHQWHDILIILQTLMQNIPTSPSQGLWDSMSECQIRRVTSYLPNSRDWWESPCTQLNNYIFQWLYASLSVTHISNLDNQWNVLIKDNIWQRGVNRNWPRTNFIFNSPTLIYQFWTLHFPSFFVVSLSCNSSDTIESSKKEQLHLSLNFRRSQNI